MPPEVYIPFTQGQSEAVDAKLLPQGLFLSAQNVRYSKDARLGVRNGYRATSMNRTPIGAASYDKNIDITINRQVTSGLETEAMITAYGATRTVSGVGTTHQEIPSGVIAPIRLMLSQQFALSDREVAAIASLYVDALHCYIAFSAILTGSNTAASPDPASSAYIILVKANPSTGQVIDIGSVSDLTGGPHTNVKMVLNNGAICLFYAATNDIRMTSFFDSASPSTMSIVTNNVVVVSAFAAKAPYFDISNGASASETYLVYQSAATTMSFGTVSSVGVYTGLNTIAGTNGFLRASISPTGLAPTDQIVIVWNDGASFTTGNLRYTVYKRSTVSFIIATTTYYTGGDTTGYPVVSGNSVFDWSCAFNFTLTGGRLRGMAVFDGGHLTYQANINNVYGHAVASKPFNLLNAMPVVLTTDVDSLTLAAGSYYLVNCFVPFVPAIVAPQVVAEFSQLSAMRSEASLEGRDPRQLVTVGATTISDSPGAAAAVFALGFVTTKGNGWKLFRGEYGALEDTINATKLNGDLHLSGARILTFDGSVVTETGLSLPNAPTLAAAGGGGLAAGTYNVLVVWEWFDAKGRRHRSAPSLPASVVVGAAGTINVTAERPFSTNKNVGMLKGNAASARVYRGTIAQPGIYLDALGTKVNLSPASGLSTTLTLSDAAIASNEALYTQGGQGGLSGLLQNDRPPGARYIWAGSDRLIIGGMENPSECWFSKLRVEGEPMQWTNFAAYKIQVDGVVTAVAEMDGTWFIGTYNSWWRVSGQGPDDNGANGSFGAPSRLPVNIGCISHKSIVAFGDGLIFQGAPDRMYLLPRGGGDPQDIGLQVRDTLAAYPYITASAFDQQSNLAYWAVCDTAGANGRLLVYDTRIKQWYVDNWIGRVIRTLAVNNSLLRIDGQAIETVGSWQDTDATTPTTVLPSLTMGDLRPFGMSGRGALRRATILGEARDVATAWSLVLSVSYDSGKTFTDVATDPVANLATAIADSIEAEHMLLYPKGDTYRFRLSWTTPTATEGMIFNGLSLEMYPAAGVNRLGPSARA